ncbi:MAG: hypothetical protein ACYC3I_10460 [Gemmataceae bacterium]
MAPYPLVSPGAETDVAQATEETPLPNDVDSAGVDRVFASLASQPDGLSESSYFVAGSDDPFVQQAALDQQPVGQNDNDPLADAAIPVNNVLSANHALSEPPNDNANNTPQNQAGVSAGGGQGPGGASTTNPSGGGSAGGRHLRHGELRRRGGQRRQLQSEHHRVGQQRRQRPIVLLLDNQPGAGRPRAH